MAWKINLGIYIYSFNFRKNHLKLFHLCHVREIISKILRRFG